MKITVIGSHLCPDTLYSLNRLTAAGIQIEFMDILSCHSALKDYLNLRENHELYSDIHGTSSLGIPCFEKEDGTFSMDLGQILESL